MYSQAQRKSYITGGNSNLVYQNKIPKDYRDENKKLNTRRFHRKSGTSVKRIIVLVAESSLALEDLPHQERP